MFIGIGDLALFVLFFVTGMVFLIILCLLVIICFYALTHFILPVYPAHFVMFYCTLDGPSNNFSVIGGIDLFICLACGIVLTTNTRTLWWRFRASWVRLLRLLVGRAACYLFPRDQAADSLLLFSEGDGMRSEESCLLTQH